MDKRIEARSGEIITFGQAQGWTMASEPAGDVDGCRSAIKIGGLFPLLVDGEIDGREFLFYTALAVSLRSNRVVTLESDVGKHARVVVELHGTIAARLGHPRYWWSPVAGAWRDALADPIAWCDFDPSAPDNLTGAST